MTQTIVWLSLYTISYKHDLLLNVISLQVESTLIVTICLAVIIQNKYEEIKKKTLGPKFLAICLFFNAAFVLLYVYNRSEKSEVENQIKKHL